MKKAAQRGAILFEHGFRAHQARTARELEPLGARIDEQVDQREVTEIPHRWNERLSETRRERHAAMRALADVYRSALTLWTERVLPRHLRPADPASEQRQKQRHPQPESHMSCPGERRDQVVQGERERDEADDEHDQLQPEAREIADRPRQSILTGPAVLR
jgi:small-conductance mechanosensitive channel